MVPVNISDKKCFDYLVKLYNSYHMTAGPNKKSYEECKIFLSQAADVRSRNQYPGGLTVTTALAAWFHYWYFLQ